MIGFDTREVHIKSNQLHVKKLQIKMQIRWNAQKNCLKLFKIIRQSTPQKFLGFRIILYNVVLFLLANADAIAAR